MKYLIVFLALALSTSSVYASNVYAIATSTQVELIEKYSSEYSINSEYMYATIEHESEFNSRAWNKSDPHGGAKGTCQFLQPTFNKYSKKLGIKNADIWSDKDCIETMAYMFSIGEGKQWTAFRNLTDSDLIRWSVE